MARAAFASLLPVAVGLLGVLACAPADRGGISGEVLAKICAAEEVDASSKIYIAPNASGAKHRLVVTPTEEIADLGNLLFDMQGSLLGYATSGEFPWDDQELRAKEQARVAKLMDGAKVPDDPETLKCK